MKRALPLGVDIGSTRLRVALSELTSQGPRVRAVVTRDVSTGVASSGVINDCSYIGALLEELRDELRSKERRCVLALGEPDAVLRTVEFPKMTEVERQRAAIFEAQRYVDYPIEDATVRIHPVDEKRRMYAIGIVRTATLKSRVDALKSGGLRPIAADRGARARPCTPGI